MIERNTKPYKTHCRCGAALQFSLEDIETGRPAELCDYWCGSGDPATGPHDWGVVTYREPTQRSPVVARG
jgi:hypothetical protein